MLPDGEKVMGVGTTMQTIPAAEAFGTINVTTVFGTTAHDQCFYAVVIANRMIGSGNSGGGVAPFDYGEPVPSDEGIRWVRGWDDSAKEAMLAAYKLHRSGLAG